MPARILAGATGCGWLLIYWLMQAVGLTHFSLLMIGSLRTLLPVALISRYRHQRDWRTLFPQGAALTAAALLQSLPRALARQRVVECAAADFNWRPDAGPRYVWCSGTIWRITPGCRSARHWFSANQLARATSGLVLLAGLLSVSGSSWIARRTVALYAILSGAGRLSRWFGTMVGASADCDIDERHRADRQTSPPPPWWASASLGVKSDRVVLLAQASSGCVNLTSRCKRNWRAISISLNGCWKPKRKRAP